MTVLRVADPAVEAVFAAYPQLIQAPLEGLRETILETAEAISGIGPIEESLKWGQPSYRPARENIGTSVRIGPIADSEADYALYVHCQTNLIATFRKLYRDRLRYSGDRAIIFSAGEIPPLAPLKHFIALALTYHVREGASAAPAAKRSRRIADTVSA
jgi:hypothetical protein